MTNEAIQSMLGVKMANWEGKFMEAIEEWRMFEIGILKVCYLRLSSFVGSSLLL